MNNAPCFFVEFPIRPEFNNSAFHTAVIIQGDDGPVREGRRGVQEVAVTSTVQQRSVRVEPVEQAVEACNDLLGCQ